jgi:prevent-host-death family protein
MGSPAPLPPIAPHNWRGKPKSRSAGLGLTHSLARCDHQIRCKFSEETTLDIANDIRSLSDFKRNTSELLERLKKTGNPLLLTINGKAEVVVQDAV